MRLNSFRSAIVMGVALASLVVVHPEGASQTAALEHYRNTRWGFCVDYPKGWKAAYGTDGSGIFVSSLRQPSDRESTGIEIGARSNQLSTENTGRMRTLQEVFRPVPDVLDTFGTIKDITILSQRRISFNGVPAISYSLAYRQAAESWRSESLVFLSADMDAVYLLELRCRTKEFGRYDQIFRHIETSFKVSCHQ